MYEVTTTFVYHVLLQMIAILAEPLITLLCVHPRIVKAVDTLSPP